SCSSAALGLLARLAAPISASSAASGSGGSSSAGLLVRGLVGASASGEIAGPSRSTAGGGWSTTGSGSASLGSASTSSITGCSATGGSPASARATPTDTRTNNSPPAARPAVAPTTLAIQPAVTGAVEASPPPPPPEGPPSSSSIAASTRASAPGAGLRRARRPATARFINSSCSTMRAPRSWGFDPSGQRRAHVHSCGPQARGDGVGVGPDRLADLARGHALDLGQHEHLAASRIELGQRSLERLDQLAIADLELEIAARSHSRQRLELALVSRALAAMIGGHPPGDAVQPRARRHVR